MADLKQIKVGSTTYNIEPYTSYLKLDGTTKMTGNLQMTENSTSILLRSASETWYSGIYANSNGDEVLGIVVANPRTHIMLGTANPLDRPAATSLTPAIDIKNGKVGINKRIGTDSSADAGSYNLDVNGSINASGTIDANSARISNGLYVGSSITHNEHNDLTIGNSTNSGYVYFVEDAAGGSTPNEGESNWTISTDGNAHFTSISEGGIALPDKYVTLATNQTITGQKTFTDNLTVNASLYTSSGAEFDGDVYFNDPVEFYSSVWTSGEITTENGIHARGNITTESHISVDGDANIDGDVKMGGDAIIAGDAKIDGQIEATNAIAINNAIVTLSAAYDVNIPVNNGSWNVNTSYSYLHYGPTGTYTLVIPEVSGLVITSSMSNLGSAQYSFAGRAATASNLTGTQQGGGSTFQASVKIPAQTITGITLTHGNTYWFNVTYKKSSSVTSIKTTASYNAEKIYLYPTASTSPKGTIAIGIGGVSKKAYYGQTNIGADSNTYEVSLGAAGKTYTYLNSPTASWAYTSDKRDKTDIESINSSLHFINKLQPVTYVENMRENYINEDGTFNQESHQMGVLKKHRRRAGFLAQDVYELLKKEYGTDNYASVVDYNRYKQEDEGVFDRYSFNGVQLIPFLVKAIQEQQDIIESLEEKINLLEEKINEGAN